MWRVHLIASGRRVSSPFLILLCSPTIGSSLLNFCCEEVIQVFETGFSKHKHTISAPKLFHSCLNMLFSSKGGETEVWSNKEEEITDLRRASNLQTESCFGKIPFSGSQGGKSIFILYQCSESIPERDDGKLGRFTSYKMAREWESCQRTHWDGRVRSVRWLVEGKWWRGTIHFCSSIFMESQRVGRGS